MRVRFPLLAKILAWFLLNLALLGLAVFLVLRIQLQLGLDSLLAGRAGQRVHSVSRLITEAIRDKDSAGQEAVLKQYSQAYKLQFCLFRPDGTQVAGETVVLPPEVGAKLKERRGLAGEGLGRGPPAGKGPRRAMDEVETEPKIDFGLHTIDPSRYWVGVRLPLRDTAGNRPWPLFLVLVLETLHGGGLFVDVRPLLLMGLAVLGASILFWLPLVHGLTSTIRKITQASQAIAEGRFETQVNARRWDELGVLGQAINRLGARLSGFVTGQKRFLGDIAHELCSPLARIQVSLGILERRADPEQKGTIRDLREEVEEMSNLINELLSFSKAGLAGGQVQLTAVNLAEVLGKVVRREAPGPGQVQVAVPADLAVLGHPDLLMRAIGNLVRNAVRYAGHAGPVTVTASRAGSGVSLVVEDHGPGVAADLLPRIFDPFFRIDLSRSRDTGGVGLGLAIVKTCVEACQGTVRASNSTGGGLRVELDLKTHD